MLDDLNDESVNKVCLDFVDGFNRGIRLLTKRPVEQSKDRRDDMLFDGFYER